MDGGGEGGGGGGGEREISGVVTEVVGIIYRQGSDL